MADINNVKVIFRKLTKDFESKGYINLNHREVNSKENLAEIASIFRDPRYETFRLIYMKKNRIVGYESISSKTPSFTSIIPNINNPKLKPERAFYKIKDRMKRLKADSYYMVHNHPSGSAKASKEDLSTTEKFSRKVPGFLGHLIINSGTYSWISINEKGYATSEDEIKIEGYKKDRLDRMLKDHPIYSVKISSRSDLVNLMHHIKNTNDFSIAVLCDSSGKTRMILDIPNSFLNNNENSIKRYFQNLAKLNGVDRVFFATDDNNAYEKSIRLIKNGTFLDSICYKKENDKLYLYENQNLYINRYRRLFDDIKDNLIPSFVSDEDESYENKDDKENKETDENDFIPKLRVLFKEPGKNPEIKIIPNTLKAKQELVRGYIEVVPYEDMLIICNEEGKIENLKPNVVFDYDYIAGPLIVAGDDYEHGNFRSLTNEELFRAKEDLIKRSYRFKVQSEDTYKHLRESRLPF